MSKNIKLLTIISVGIFSAGVFSGRLIEKIKTVKKVERTYGTLNVFTDINTGQEYIWAEFSEKIEDFKDMRAVSFKVVKHNNDINNSHK